MLLCVRPALQLCFYSFNGILFYFIWRLHISSVFMQPYLPPPPPPPPSPPPRCVDQVHFSVFKTACATAQLDSGILLVAAFRAPLHGFQANLLSCVSGVTTWLHLLDKCNLPASTFAKSSRDLASDLPAWPDVSG